MNTTSMHYSALEIWFRIKMLYMSVFGDTLTTGVELQNITRFTKLSAPLEEWLEYLIHP